MEEVHAEASLRMGGIRSVCELRLRKSKNRTLFDLQIRQSTVMLAANVAFLAIQGVIVVPPSETGWIKPSPTQITSTTSLLFSLGSITTGLLLIRRNRTMAVQGAGKAVR